MMYPKRFAPILILAAAVSAAGAQEQLEPVSPNVRRAVASFFQYDRNIPLSARVVDEQETELCRRHKIVFTGARDGRVPGLPDIARLRWWSVSTNPSTACWREFEGNVVRIWWSGERLEVDGGVVKPEISWNYWNSVKSGDYDTVWKLIRDIEMPCGLIRIPLKAVSIAWFMASLSFLGSAKGTFQPTTIP